MPDYQAMYLRLFNKVTTAIDILQSAQKEGEEFLKREEPQNLEQS